MEAVALEEYRLLFGRLPEVNEAVSELATFGAEQVALTDRPRD
jgi:hypothetical protein